MRRSFPLLMFALLGGCRRHVKPPIADPIPPVSQKVIPSEPQPPAPEWPPPLAAKAPPPREAPPAITTLNGNPKGPTADGMSAVIQAGSLSLQGCLDADSEIPPGQLSVQIVYKILPTGSPADVGVTAAGVPAPVIDCIKGRFEALQFPPFEGNPVLGGYPMVYSRVEKK